MRKATVLMALAAAVAMAPRAAHAQTRLTCDSPCTRGRSWGYSRDAVWVSRGCRAEFAVGSYGSGGYGNGGYDRNGDNRNGGYNGNGTQGSRNGNGNNGYLASARATCQRAVRDRVGARSVRTWVEDESRNNARIGWRASNGESGTCRVQSNGRVTLRTNRGR